MIKNDILAIIGIDGLDYKLVNKWNLLNLKQKHCRKISVPISPRIQVPSSPMVWSSFFIGKYSDLDGFYIERKRKKTFSILRSIRRFVPISLGLHKNLSPQSKPSRFPEFNQKTFLDEDGVVHYNAPFKGFDNKTFDLIYEFNHGRIKIPECRHLLKEILESRFKEIGIFLDNFNSNVFFGYIHALDAIQHLSINQKDVREFYSLCDEYISNIKDGFQGCLVIVSDHGYDWDKGTHSLDGFYSSNIKIKPEPRDITDFYKIIKSYL